MKFDICIMNPPYKRNCYIGFIKKNRLISNRIVLIIPDINGNIDLKEFDCKHNKCKLSIFSINKNEKVKKEMFCNKILTEFYICLPDNASMLNNFYETGSYKNTNFETSKYMNNHKTFNFLNNKDLQEFKNRLYKKDWCKIKGILIPNYQDILKGLNYIKSYREI